MRETRINQNEFMFVCIRFKKRLQRGPYTPYVFLMYILIYPSNHNNYLRNQHLLYKK